MKLSGQMQTPQEKEHVALNTKYDAFDPMTYAFEK